MKKILVVDDEQEICDLVKENLEHLGKVTCATTLIEALTLCAQENFDFVVIDKGTLKSQIAPEDFVLYAKLNYKPQIISITGGSLAKNDLYKCDPVFYEKMSIMIAETIAKDSQLKAA